MDLSVPLVIAAASALVGLLCLWLMLVALLRLRKVRKGKGPLGDTPADLKSFALRQLLSAVVMVALAAIIFVYS
ncbi:MULTISPECIES: hypothetical protein [unclassified Sphingomonas]|uniref:hypothetical protein n=1 Tax=unclassified Sphingomonas TaxID=196159 RepID=UPI0006F242B0|nr:MULTISPECIES: hypothetical protein [unclassified Sphingomonas]KQX26314.1 hypothetical protein ASD17_02400 [Sphingomonas sp. Root1294]KQY69385.1 hypothetical protein ASD39_03610 [Sphingomonas sp. Root50]KRB89643.1 hypothetical protein ASE22_18520 [Sphingomonas sp. Root720]